MTYGAGDTVELTLTGTADGYTLRYGDNEVVSAGFDYPLTANDPDYIYVGFYAARNADITFSDVQLTTTGSSSPAGGSAARAAAWTSCASCPPPSDAVENWYYDTMLLFWEPQSPAI